MNIKSTECECPRGAFKCSHAAAVFIYAIHHVSRTDIECRWNKPKKPTCPAVRDVTEMFPPPKQYCALSREPTQADRSSIYRSLCKYGKFTGLWWILSPEPEPVTLPMLTIEEIIYSDGFLQAHGKEDQLSFFKEKCKIQSSTIQEIAKLTVGQRENPAWSMLRKGRLTASNFGPVLAAKRVSQSLLKRLMGEYDLSGVKAITWGVNNEKEAVNAFEMSNCLKVEPTGIWFEESGILGATPDGLVDQKGILEVKCPYTFRNSTIEEVIESESFYLEKRKDKIELKRDHKSGYWHQIQGQLHLTNRMYCYFVVWTVKGHVTLVIHRDEEWKPNLDILRNFYFHHYYPKMIEGELL